MQGVWCEQLRFQIYLLPLQRPALALVLAFLSLASYQVELGEPSCAILAESYQVELYLFFTINMVGITVL